MAELARIVRVHELSDDEESSIRRLDDTSSYGMPPAAPEAPKTSDFCWLLVMVVACVIILLSGPLFQNCGDPLYIWSSVDVIGFTTFRALHLSTNMLRASQQEHPVLESVLVLLTLIILYPFLWVWTVVGTLWMQRAFSCLQLPVLFWSFIIWVIISYLYLIIYGFAICTGIRSVMLADEPQPRRSIIMHLLELQRAAQPPVGLTEEEVATISVSKLASTSLARFESGLACSICLEDMSAGDETRRLACGHHFHPTCIGSWLRKKNECPACRRPALARFASSVLSLTDLDSGLVDEFDDLSPAASLHDAVPPTDRSLRSPRSRSRVLPEPRRSLVAAAVAESVAAGIRSSTRSSARSVLSSSAVAPVLSDDDAAGSRHSLSSLTE